jgi:hypothetical protein
VIPQQKRREGGADEANPRAVQSASARRKKRNACDHRGMPAAVTHNMGTIAFQGTSISRLYP